VRGPVALCPEILGGLNDATAKVLFPHPVDGHARCERVVFVRQPVCEAKPVHGLIFGEWLQDGRNTGRYFITLVEKAALNPGERL